MKKYCSFKLEKILGLDTNKFRCGTCDEVVYTKSARGPVQCCRALQHALVIPDELQQYISYAMKWPKPHHVEGEMYFFQLKNNRMLQTPAAALTPDFLEYIRENALVE